MSTIDDLSDRLEMAKDNLRDAERRLEDFEPDDREAHERYDAVLDDTYGDVDVCGYKMNAGYVLKNMDEIAYNEGFNDWLDSEDKSTFDGYDELADDVETYQSLVEDLESQIEELEDGE
jgi:hypothetical protein